MSSDEDDKNKFPFTIWCLAFGHSTRTHDEWEDLCTQLNRKGVHARFPLLTEPPVSVSHWLNFSCKVYRPTGRRHHPYKASPSSTSYSSDSSSRVSTSCDNSGFHDNRHIPTISSLQPTIAPISPTSFAHWIPDSTSWEMTVTCSRLSEPRPPFHHPGLFDRQSTL